MKLNQFRRVDYFIGIPGCFFLTVLDKLLLLVTHKSSLKPKKILFIKMLGMGSIILSFPLLIETRKRYPEAKIFFLTFSSNVEVPFLLSGLVDEVLTISTKTIKIFLKDFATTLLRLRREKIDTVLDLEFFSRFTAIYSYLTGARNRIGFYNYHTEGLYRGNLFNYKVFYNHYLHTAKQYFVMLDALDQDKNQKPLIKEDMNNIEVKMPKYLSQKVEVQDIFSILRRETKLFNEDSEIYIFNNNASDLAKNLKKWENGKMAELVDRVLESNKKALAVFVGSPAESFENEEIIRLIKSKRVINFAGKSSIKELLTLFNISKSFVSLDSGLMHLASLTEIDMVGIFSIETPELFGPLSDKAKTIYGKLSCQPCLTIYNGKTAYCNDNKCMKNITVEQVFELIKF